MNVDKQFPTAATYHFVGMISLLNACLGLGSRRGKRDAMQKRQSPLLRRADCLQNH
jgi:hypothetical protein